MYERAKTSGEKIKRGNRNVTRELPREGSMGLDGEGKQPPEGSIRHLRCETEIDRRKIICMFYTGRRRRGGEEKVAGKNIVGLRIIRIIIIVLFPCNIHFPLEKSYRQWPSELAANVCVSVL